ncbi:hypothetical protein [Corynebacterium kefirresidentii]|uniref:hypothetical protein n=1 Tax=Corynebacterium kefirresidentii TaxID=1979527 RepID=UPI0011789840|nr:hypothetical protein [Corynebacterium kefirresidentii]
MSFHPRRAHRPLYPLADKVSERPAGQYAPRKRPHCPSHALYQRRDKEFFFRDVARRQLADALPHPAILTQPAVRITATAAMSIPLLPIASIFIGGITALEAPPTSSSLPPHRT